MISIVLLIWVLLFLLLNLKDQNPIIFILVFGKMYFLQVFLALGMYSICSDISCSVSHFYSLYVIFRLRILYPWVVHMLVLLLFHYAGYVIVQLLCLESLCQSSIFYFLILKLRGKNEFDPLDVDFLCCSSKTNDTLFWETNCLNIKLIPKLPGQINKRNFQCYSLCHRHCTESGNWKCFF
jgi:hypothetical protein